MAAIAFRQGMAARAFPRALRRSSQREAARTWGQRRCNSFCPFCSCPSIYQFLGPSPSAHVSMSRTFNPVELLWACIRANERVHVTWCVVGIVGCLMMYGVLQERIMVEPYGIGATAEVFKYSLFLVLCNRLTSCLVAILGLVTNGKMSEIRPVAPLYSYAAVSLSNIVATFCQYEALKYVSFPVQTLGKCAKMMPVMIWGIIMLHKRYNCRDFGMALLITAGCTAFLLTGEVKSKVSASMFDSSVFGLSLMLGYLGFDGFTSTFQDVLFKGFQMTTYNQILYTTLFSSVLSLFGLVSSGQFPLAIDFLQRHPEALWNVVALSVAATVGSLFISYTIKTFGSLTFATIMTTRQFLSILLSCLLFAHPLSIGQWLGTVVVFGTLYYQSFAKQDKGHAHGKDASAKHVHDPEKAVLVHACEPADEPLKQPLIAVSTLEVIKG